MDKGNGLMEVGVMAVKGQDLSKGEGQMILGQFVLYVADRFEFITQ